MNISITVNECEQIAEILERRANEIAGFSEDYRSDPKHFGSVELALSREINRLRRLADKITPPSQDVYECPKQSNPYTERGVR